MEGEGPREVNLNEYGVCPLSLALVFTYSYEKLSRA